MYALYHAAENEYVGIQTWSDGDSTAVCLTPSSNLDEDDLSLLISYTRERAQSFVDIASAHYHGFVPGDSLVNDFLCGIENLSEYRVVKIGIVQE